MNPLAVYVHIPFCTVKCGYCDFNAYAGLKALQPRYAEAVVTEIMLYRDTLAGRPVRSIGFGGGTPGEMPPRDIGAMIAAVADLGVLSDGAEISLEANPGSTTPAALREFRAAGVNRISFGAQSFDPGELRFLDRIHSPEAIAASVREARRAGIASVNLDLIYGLPGQTAGSWGRSLGSAIALEPDHVSAYALTVEEGTPLALKVQRGAVVPVDGDAVADLYEQASDVLDAAGYRQYELSNWARPGHESRHNQTYWTDGEYLGVGAGAHGYLSGRRLENIAHPGSYIEAVRCGRLPVSREYVPEGAIAVSDWISLALRLIEGFDPRRFAERFGAPLEAAAGPPLRECAEAGLVSIEDDRVALTGRGRLLHGEVSARVLRHVQDLLQKSPGLVVTGPRPVVAAVQPP